MVLMMIIDEVGVIDRLLGLAKGSSHGRQLCDGCERKVIQSAGQLFAAAAADGNSDQ